MPWNYLLDRTVPQMYGQWGLDCRGRNQCWIVATERLNFLMNLYECQTNDQATETLEVSMTAAILQSFYSSIKLKK